MVLSLGNDVFHGRFDWYAWSAPACEGAEAVLKALSVQDFRKKRLKGVRVVGAARNMSGEALRECEEKFGQAAASGEGFRRFLRLPHSVTLCEPFILDFDDGTALEFLPGEGISARIGRNRIPPSCTEGLNRPNFRPERFFTPYLAGQRLENVFLEEESSVLRQYAYSGGKVESSRREGLVVRYEFLFSSHKALTVTTEGGGWYELSFGRGEAASLPYLKFFSASLGMDQPLLCHGGSGEEPCFLLCAEAPTGSGMSSIPDISMNEDVLETYLLPFLERRFEPELNVCEAWEPEGFDFYGSNYYAKETVRDMLSDIRTAVSALRRGEETLLRKRLLEKVPDVLCRMPVGTPSEEAFPAVAVNFYEPFSRAWREC